MMTSNRYSPSVVHLTGAHLAALGFPKALINVHARYFKGAKGEATLSRLESASETLSDLIEFMPDSEYDSFLTRALATAERRLKDETDH